MAYDPHHVTSLSSSLSSSLPSFSTNEQMKFSLTLFRYLFDSIGMKNLKDNDNENDENTTNIILSPYSILSSLAMLTPGIQYHKSLTSPSPSPSNDVDYVYKLFNVLFGTFSTTTTTTTSTTTANNNDIVLNHYINEFCSLQNQLKIFNTKLNIVNAIYLRHNPKYQLSEQYSRSIQQTFGGIIHEIVDHNIPTSEEIFNDFYPKLSGDGDGSSVLSSLLDNIIKSITTITATSLSSSSLALINVINFSGKWMIPFDTKQTKLDRFYRTPIYDDGDHDHDHQDVLNCMMMQNESMWIPYYESMYISEITSYTTTTTDKLTKAILLPYATTSTLSSSSMDHHQLALLLLLPPLGMCMKTFIHAITDYDNVLHNILSKMCMHEVSVGIPSFTITNIHDHHILLPILKQLGFGSIFNPITARLNKIRVRRPQQQQSPSLPIINDDDDDDQDQLFVSTLIQQASITVNEYGTVATAITATSVADSPVKSFYANHPFVYAIISNTPKKTSSTNDASFNYDNNDDEYHRQILFIGAFHNPPI